MKCIIKSESKIGRLDQVEKRHIVGMGSYYYLTARTQPGDLLTWRMEKKVLVLDLDEDELRLYDGSTQCEDMGPAAEFEIRRKKDKE